MSRNRKPTTLASVIFWWVLAIGAVIFDFVVLVPNDTLTWWQIALTIFLIGGAIFETIKYRKQQTGQSGDDNE